MELEPGFFKTVWRLALPIALQSVLQASFSVVDQIMIGQLGSVQVAGVGLAGKFASIFTVLVSAVAAVVGIMLAYRGSLGFSVQRNRVDSRVDPARGRKVRAIRNRYSAAAHRVGASVV